MDYRNHADGPDGLIEFARDEVVYAGKVGKRVYVGVETAPAEPSRKFLLWGFSRADWDGISSDRFPLLFTNRLNGFHVTTFDGKEREYIGLTDSGGEARKAELESSLEQLRAMVKNPRPAVSDAAQLRQEAEAAVAANREFEGFAPYVARDGETAGFRTTSKATPKITFAGKTSADLEKELAAVAAAFRGRPGFFGFAIHHYGSYRALPGFTN